MTAMSAENTNANIEQHNTILHNGVVYILRFPCVLLIAPITLITVQNNNHVWVSTQTLIVQIMHSSVKNILMLQTDNFLKAFKLPS